MDVGFRVRVPNSFLELIVYVAQFCLILQASWLPPLVDPTLIPNADSLFFFVGSWIRFLLSHSSLRDLSVSNSNETYVLPSFLPSNFFYFFHVLVLSLIWFHKYRIIPRLNLLSFYISHTPTHSFSDSQNSKWAYLIAWWLCPLEQVQTIHNNRFKNRKCPIKSPKRMISQFTSELWTILKMWDRM